MYLDCSPVVLAAPVKICKKCGEVKLPDDFHRDRRRPDGRFPYCKVCMSAHTRKWYEDNREYANAKSKERREANPEREAEKNRRWRKANTEHIAEYKRANRERITNTRKAWEQTHPNYAKERYWANPERARERSKNWAQQHQEEIAEKARGYRRIHREHIAARMREWRTNNLNTGKIHKARRKARKLNLPDNFTADDWECALNYFRNCCAVCGRQIGLWHRMAADHWIPLTSPDCPGTVAWNMVPLCHGVDGCNNSKKDKPPTDWLIEKFGPRKGRAILKRIEAFLESRKSDAA